METVELEMTRIIQSKRMISFVVAVVACGLIVGATTANAATKSITCYKGASLKIVKAVAPKCPTGWSIKKPKSSKPAPSKPGTSKSLNINATYTGTISTLWTASSVSATSVTATGTGTTLGLTKLVGSGSSSPASQCDTIQGSGYITDGTNTLKANFDPAAQGCGKESAAPTTVTIGGSAVISGGTGKYAGAKGTLKFTGSFPVDSTAAGTNATSPLTFTITGSFTTK